VGKFAPACAPVRTQVLASLAITLLRRLNVTNIAATRRYFAARPAHA